MKTWIKILLATVALGACDRPKMIGQEPIPQNGWVIDTVQPNPSIGMISHGSLVLVMTCKESVLNIQLRDVAPANQFPQPNITYKFGGDVWEGRPVASDIGSQVALEVQFSVGDNGMRDKSTLAWIRDSGGMIVEFLGQPRLTTTIPPNIAKPFVAACEKSWDLPE